jgi:alpha-tubulin suppressor-like RCC1 family protein
MVIARIRFWPWPMAATLLTGCRLSDQPQLIANAAPDAAVIEPLCPFAKEGGKEFVSNACGGCTVLSAEPGVACGNCGTYQCASKENVVCNDKGYVQIKAIASGDVHMCALLTNGAVRCWGYNGNGQLGLGPDADAGANRSTPTTTDVLTGVKAISAGFYHTCALMLNGEVRCWGADSEGQIGDGQATNDAFTPIKVDIPAAVQSVVAGNVHTCAITTNGGVRCWGSNGDGQLGTGQLGDVILPDDPKDRVRLDVPGTDVLTDVLTIAAADQTCALLASSRGIRCWGRNKNGQLGDGNAPTDVLVPPMGDLNLGGVRVTSVAAGADHTCVMTATSPGVRCWGSNSDGQLGDGNAPNDRSQPPATDVLSGVADVTAGFHHTCVLTTSNGVRCWGDNSYGQLGDGNYPTDRSTPPDMDLISGVKSVVAAGNHTCVLMINGGIRCWGDNGAGVLGDGDTGDIRASPPANDIPGLDRICP